MNDTNKQALPQYPNINDQARVSLDQAKIQRQALAEQIRIIYQQLPQYVVGMNLVAWIVAAVLWNDVPHQILIPWLITSLAVGGFAFTGLYWLHRRTNPLPDDAGRWGIYFAALTGLGAFLYGSSGFLFFVPDRVELQLFLAMCVLGIMSAVMATTASYRPAFHAAFEPTLLPLFIRLLLEGGTIQYGIALAILLYWVTVTYGYGNVHRGMVRSIRLGFENMALAKALMVEKQAADRAKEVAEQANLAKSRFLAAASHDLRQPLHAQGLFVGELRSRLDDPTARIKVIEKLEASIDSMGSLFNALLDISKLDAGVVQPKIKDFYINGLLVELESEYAPQAQAKGLKYRIRSCDACVRADPALLASIMHNFVSNSIRYTAAGGVLVGCRRRGQLLRIEVWDSGIGIPKEYLEKIFQEFYQIGNPERDRSQGLGLGLAVVDRLSKLLGCPIHLSSVEGKGSRFSVEVPLGSDQAVQSQDEDDNGLEEGSLNDICVLVIDDDAEVLTAMQGLLDTWGCYALVASSAEEALARYADWEHRPDLIVADYRLRDKKTGVQAIERIHSELQRKIPAILITGDIAADRLIEVQSSGYPILHKPVHPARLRTLLTYMLRKEAPDPRI